jgi:hypothetical protein
MTNQAADPAEAARAAAEAVAAGGGEIRPRLGDAVARAAEQSQRAGHGLVAVVRAVLEGAREGFEKSRPADPGDAFRQVIDALGDGLSQAALAARLAVEEARGAGRQFAQDDLTRLRDDLQAVRSLFAESVSRTLRDGRGLAGAELSSVVAHAGRVGERLGGVVSTVLAAVFRDPLAVAAEGVQAGVRTGRHAAGALFAALGGMLERAGEHLRREPRHD